MKHPRFVRNVSLAGIGFVAGIGVLGFGSIDPGSSRTGLETYRLDAMEAVEPGEDLGRHSNAEIAVVMEVRNVCRELALYVRSEKPDPDALARRLHAGEERARAVASGDGEGAASIDAFVDFALSRIEEGRKLGSLRPMQELIQTDCDADQDYTRPILAADG